MTSKKIICAGCTTLIDDRRYLTCSLCKNVYDLLCANVSEQRFYNTMTKEHKLSWLCVECKSAQPKQDNTNTPVRAHDENVNINLARGSSTHRRNIEQSLQESFNIDLSETGETCQLSPTQTSTTITLENISQLLDYKLKQNNSSFFAAMQIVIQKEISEGIKKIEEKFAKETTILTTNYRKITCTIQDMEKRLKTVELENEQLRQKLTYLQNSDDNKQQHNILHNGTDTKIVQQLDTTDKKIILYGLPENEYETEYELHDRIIYIFRDLLNVDLLGYIEEVGRVGKPGRLRKMRPVYVELISKRMTKYVIQNSRCFKNTNLVLSKFLDSSELETRKVLREKLLRARENGSHAVIRNNKLIVNGVYVPTMENQENQQRPQSPKTADNLQARNRTKNDALKTFR